MRRGARGARADDARDRGQESVRSLGGKKFLGGVFWVGRVVGWFVCTSLRGNKVDIIVTRTHWS